MKSSNATFLAIGIVFFWLVQVLLLAVLDILAVVVLLTYLAGAL